MIAEVFGTSRTAIARWESGTRWPQITDLRALSELFGVSVSDLLPDPLDDNLIEQECTNGQAKATISKFRSRN